MGFERSPQTEKNDIEIRHERAKDFENILNTINPKTEKEVHTGSAINEACVEIMGGNYELAQQAIEANVEWNEPLRVAAIKLHESLMMDKGEKPMSLSGAQDLIEKAAETLNDSIRDTNIPYHERQQSLRIANEIRSVAYGLTLGGLDEVTTAFEYVEHRLSNAAREIRNFKGGDEVDQEFYDSAKEIIEKERQARDSLFKEQQRLLNLEKEKKV